MVPSSPNLFVVIPTSVQRARAIFSARVGRRDLALSSKTARQLLAALDLHNLNPCHPE